MQWHEIVVQTGQKRKAQYLTHERTLIDAVRAVCGPRKSVQLVRMAPTQPRGTRRGQWRLSVWIGASQRVPRVAQDLVATLQDATGSDCRVVGTRQPLPRALTLNVRGEIDLWVRPEHHGNRIPTSSSGACWVSRQPNTRFVPWQTS